MGCFICTNSALHGLPMQDKDELARRARDFIQGLFLTARQSGKEAIKSFRPSRRRGISIVERCARTVEMGCGNCQKDSCERCKIAAELRLAEVRIHEERDAELAERGFDDQDLEDLIDKVVGGLCEEHAAFGSALVSQWYGRQNILGSPSSQDA